jgi:hypothetical protein
VSRKAGPGTPPGPPLARNRAMAHNPRVAEPPETTTVSDHDREEAEVRAARQRAILAMTPAERLALMDRLCRELTRFAAQAHRRP